MSSPFSRTKSGVKQSKFSILAFVISFFVLLLMSGVHEGINVLMKDLDADNKIQIAIPVLYWAGVALGITMFTGWRIKKTYEEPMQTLAKATSKVAGGDFSVYVPPLHTSDKLDYLDIMLLDFNKMVAELGSIEALKTDFFSNVSHEIKTPLAVIQSNAELLHKDRVSDERRTEYVDTILQGSKRLSNLITNMLKLNKLEKQTIKPMPEAYNLCNQLCECALQFEDVWERKNIEFVADIEDCAIIQADQGLMEIVWTNLLSNALKFTQDGGTIIMKQTSDEDTVTVSFSDTGCGMDEETARHIFEKFYQGDTSHSTEGNGLGLALVQRILQLSDGTISLSSVAGKGTTFIVTMSASMNSEEDSNG